MQPHVYKRKNAKSTVRNTAITVLVMVILFVLVGVGYVYYTGRKPAKKPAAAATTQPIRNYGLPKPKTPSPNSPAYAAIEALLSPVPAGSNTSATVATVPTSKCDITATYNNVPSKDSGLASKTADPYGHITWSWTVDKSAPVGTWPVKVTCFYGKKSAVVIGNLQVTK
jgi:hypothetical protein